MATDPEYETSDKESDNDYSSSFTEFNDDDDMITLVNKICDLEFTSCAMLKNICDINSKECFQNMKDYIKNNDISNLTNDYQNIMNNVPDHVHFSKSSEESKNSLSSTISYLIS